MRNYTAESFTNPQPGQKRKRQRESTSCRLCRDRKVACDRARPACATCVSRKCASSCVYDDDNGSEEAVNDSRGVAPAGHASSAVQHHQASSANSSKDSPPRFDGAVSEYLNKQGFSIPEGVLHQGTTTAEARTSSTNGNTSEQTSAARISRLERRIEELSSRVDSLESSGSGDMGGRSTQTTNPYSNAVLDGKRCPETSFYIGQHSWSMMFSKDVCHAR